MRSLIIGIILFLIWSALSTWYYSIRTFNVDEPESVSVIEDQKPEPITEVSEPEKPEPPEEYKIYFGFNRADFIPEEDLDEFCEECKNYLLMDTAACLLITGHTDSKGAEQYNMKLGEKRALNVKQYLLTMGFSDACMNTISSGETEPVAENTTSEGRAKNRRVELVINQ